MNIILNNDDCLKTMSKLKNDSIDLIVTDPPYPVTSRGSAGNSGGMLRKDINRKGKVFQYNDIDCSKYLPEFFRILKDGSHCYIMTNHINLQKMLNTATDCGFHFIKSLIWNKGNKIMGQAYMSQFEYILFFRKGKFKKINHCGTSDILEVPNKKTKGEDGKNLHDTEKPIELMKILIDNSTTDENDIVYEPFAGIGAVPLACIQLNKNCLVNEIDKNYYGIMKKRINNYIQINNITNINIIEP